MEITVETPQPGHIARRMRIEPETILLYIPGRSSRIDVVDNETKQIDQQKAYGITKEPLLVAIEQIPRKRQGQRNPAEKKEPRQHIRESGPVRQPIFIERPPPDPKQS